MSMTDEAGPCGVSCWVAHEPDWAAWGMFAEAKPRRSDMASESWPARVRRVASSSVFKLGWVILPTYYHLAGRHKDGEAPGRKGTSQKVVVPPSPGHLWASTRCGLAAAVP